MAEHLSKERVERDGYLVYAEGDPIPETDVDELKRQGYITASGKPAEKPAEKAQQPAANKARRPAANKSK